MSNTLSFYRSKNQKRPAAPENQVADITKIFYNSTWL